MAVLPAADGTAPSVCTAQGLLRLAQLLRLLERPPKRLLLVTSGAQVTARIRVRVRVKVRVSLG